MVSCLPFQHVSKPCNSVSPRLYIHGNPENQTVSFDFFLAIAHTSSVFLYGSVREVHLAGIFKYKKISSTSESRTMFKFVYYIYVKCYSSKPCMWPLVNAMPLVIEPQIIREAVIGLKVFHTELLTEHGNNVLYVISVLLFLNVNEFPDVHRNRNFQVGTFSQSASRNTYRKFFIDLPKSKNGFTGRFIRLESKNFSVFFNPYIFLDP